MPNSSRRDTVELKRPRARLNLLLLIPAVAVLSAAGIFANPGTVVSMPSAANQSPPAKIEARATSFNAATNLPFDSNPQAKVRAVKIHPSKRTSDD
jgi:hypothetical protein